MRESCEAYSTAHFSRSVPDLSKSAGGNTVSIIACPVDRSENIKLTDKLRESEFFVDPA